MSTSATAPFGRAWILSDEPLPVRLMNTIWADTDGIHDDLRTTADVDEWLDAVGVDRAGARATESELGRARALRDAVRRLAAYLTADVRPSAESATTGVATALGQLNSTAADLPAPCLALRGGRLESDVQKGASPV